MKKVILGLLIGIISINPAYSQKNKNTAIGAGVGALAGAIAITASIEQVKEELEQNATEWLLDNYEFENGETFELKLLRFQGNKISDLSRTSSLAFSIKIPSQKKNFILLLITSKGWWNQHGVVYNRLTPILVDKTKLDSWLIPYISNICVQDKFRKNHPITSTDSIAFPPKRKSGEIEWLSLGNIKDFRNEKIEFLKVTSSGRAADGLYYENGITYRLKIISLLNGDVHRIIKVNDNIMIDYNEEDFNLYLKSTHDLIKIKRNLLEDMIKIIY